MWFLFLFLSHYYSSLIILDAKAAALVLGYDERLWNYTQDPELVEDSDWDKLTNEQQAAAAVLGDCEANWDEE